MPTAEETRAATALVTLAAVDEARSLVRAMKSPDQGRRLAFATVPAVIAHYGSGAAALAVDRYAEKRELAGVRSAYIPRQFAIGNERKLFNAIAWATDPLYGADFSAAFEVEVARRLRDVVSAGVADAGRSTTLGNVKADPAALGWSRTTGGHGCPFCRMLASRGAVYRSETTAVFAAHDNCDCTAEGWFKGEKIREADTIQYMASSRSKSPKQKAALNKYLRDNFPASDVDAF